MRVIYRQINKRSRYRMNEKCKVYTQLLLLAAKYKRRQSTCNFWQLEEFSTKKGLTGSAFPFRTILSCIGTYNYNVLAK